MGFIFWKFFVWNSVGIFPFIFYFCNFTVIYPLSIFEYKNEKNEDNIFKIEWIELGKKGFLSVKKKQ